MLESNRGSGCKSTEKEETKEEKRIEDSSSLSSSISNLTRVRRNLGKIWRPFENHSWKKFDRRASFPSSFSALPSLSLFARRHSAPAGFLRRAKLVSRTARGETTRGEYVTTIISGLKWGLISFGAGGGEEGRRWRRRSRSGDGGVGCRRASRLGWGEEREMRVYTCRETCGLVHGIGGPYGLEERRERRERECDREGERRTGTRERPEHARATCNWVQSSWFSSRFVSIAIGRRSRPSV